MALGIAITQPTQAVATYWRIGRIRIDRIQTTIDIDIYGYLNQTARLAGASPLAYITIPVSTSDYEILLAGTNLASNAYMAAKSFSEFMGAADV